MALLGVGSSEPQTPTGTAVRLVAQADCFCAHKLSGCADVFP